MVKVTVYFKDAKGNTIAEEDYTPVLVSNFNFMLSDSNKPLKPNYIWQMERGKFYTAKSVPSEWKEGAAEIRITDLQFKEQSTSGEKQELGSTPLRGVPPTPIPRGTQQDASVGPARDTPKFNAHEVAQVLDKREPQRQVTSAESLNDLPTLGAAIGAQNAQRSQSEIDALRARISSCWSSPPGIDVNSKVYVVLRILFKADGSMVQAPTLVEGSASPLAPALAESAKRALMLCQPFTMLRPEHYDQWKDIQLRFDPHELLGG